MLRAHQERISWYVGFGIELGRGGLAENKEKLT